MSESAVGRERVSVEKFIEVNEQMAKDGKGIADIAASLGLSPAYVAQRRTNLRSRGVPLTELTRGGHGNKTNLDEAVALVAKLQGKNVDEVKAAGAELVAASVTRKAERAAEKS